MISPQIIDAFVGTVGDRLLVGVSGSTSFGQVGGTQAAESEMGAGVREGGSRSLGQVGGVAGGHACRDRVTTDSVHVRPFNGVLFERLVKCKRHLCKVSVSC